jgi:hypothetical protein
MMVGDNQYCAEGHGLQASHVPAQQTASSGSSSSSSVAVGVPMHALPAA